MVALREFEVFALAAALKSGNIGFTLEKSGFLQLFK